LYGYRFKIGCTFREIKQVIGALGYRFWSKSMPKLNRFLKKEEVHPFEAVTNEQDRHRIQRTLQAIEGFVMCQCIAMGLLQWVALRFQAGRRGSFSAICVRPPMWCPRPLLPFIYASLFFACLLKTRIYL
jgi:hypothetical protein